MNSVGARGAGQLLQEGTHRRDPGPVARQPRGDHMQSDFAATFNQVPQRRGGRLRLPTNPLGRSSCSSSIRTKWCGPVHAGRASSSSCVRPDGGRRSRIMAAVPRAPGRCRRGVGVGPQIPVRDRPIRLVFGSMTVICAWSGTLRGDRLADRGQSRRLAAALPTDHQQVGDLAGGDGHRLQRTFRRWRTGWFSGSAADPVEPNAETMSRSAIAPAAARGSRPSRRRSARRSPHRPRGSRDAAAPLRSGTSGTPISSSCAVRVMPKPGRSSVWRAALRCSIPVPICVSSGLLSRNWMRAFDDVEQRLLPRSAQPLALVMMNAVGESLARNGDGPVSTALSLS